MEKRILETVEHNTVQLGRIAFALEEILRLVKEDQAQYKKKSKDEEEQSWPTGLGKEENAKEKN
jgi:hypothetical protein